MNVVLVSGGADCMAVLTKVKADIALFFDYGQRGRKYEKKAAKWAAKHWHAKFVCFNARRIYENSGSILVNKKGYTEEVTCRNLLFATIAQAMYPGAKIFLGIHKSTIHDLPDCTLEFVRTANKLGVNIQAPFINSYKDKLLACLSRYEIDHSYTCYLGSKKGTWCTCTACSTMRKFGF